MSDTFPYTAKPGDYLVKVAQDHGTTWQAIWNHPLNAEHRRKRGSPDVLYAGDVLHIPITESPARPGAGGGEAPPARPPDLPPSIAWPYPSPPLPFPETSAPTWVCPEGICTCADHESATEPVSHIIFLYDDASRRMPHALCRVHAAGRILPAPIAADASGAITFDVPRGLQSVLVEWAPAAAPDLPTLPFRRLYHLDFGPPDRDGVRRRLDHIGVSGGLFLEERIRDFQETYGHPVDGLVTSVAVPLAAYHDRAMLPPLDGATGTVAGPPLPPEERGPRQGALSGVLLAECHVSLQMLNTRNEPIANTPFALEVGGGRLFEGRTDGQGRLEFGDVEAGDYALRIGDLRIHVPAVRKSERHRPLVADE